MIRKLLVLLCLLLPTAARAEWREATSTNFVVYTEGSEAEAHEFAAKLERYNYVLRRFHNIREPAQAPRFRVFLLQNLEAVQRMADARGSGIAGYYIPDSRALMFVGMRAAGSQRSFNPEMVLFHEYVHHFMYQYFPATYPTWYSEGYPEFWASIRFLENDVVEIGHPQEGRFRSFVQGMNRWVPLRQLMTAQSYSDIPEIDRPRGLHEYQRTCEQHLWKGARIVVRVRHRFGERPVPGRAHECRKSPVGDRVAIHREAIHRHPMHWPLLGIVLV